MNQTRSEATKTISTRQPREETTIKQEVYVQKTITIRQHRKRM